MVWFQVSGRKGLESSLRQLEREKALLQHKSQESHRKAESEADRKRCLENEGEVAEVGNPSVVVLHSVKLLAHRESEREGGREAEKDEAIKICLVMHQRRCQQPGTLREVGFGSVPYFTHVVC